MNYYLVAVKIGSGITGGGTAGDAVSGLNDALKAAGTAVGAVLVIVAAIKMIMAMANEDSSSKTQSTMLLSVGILFISLSNVLTSLGVENINSSTSVNSVASKIITVTANMLTYAGGALGLFAALMLIISIAQENSDAHVNGSKLLGVSIGLLSIGSLATTINILLLTNTTRADSYVNAIATFFAKTATYIGGGLALMGVFRLIMAIREEDSRERSGAIRLLMAGIGLLSIAAILRGMGFTVGS